MIILLIYKPTYTFPGLAIVLLGIPVFFAWKKFSGKNRNQSADEADYH
jgi:APA family basic amino acid/polyamine antiporter